MSANSVVWAGIDIGTNSVKLLVARVHFPDESFRLDVLRHSVHVTRMGEGLNASGALGQAPMERAMEAIQRLQAEAAEFHPQGMDALGMQAFRQARNGADFARRITEVTGIPVRILSGLEEASLSREGVLRGFGGALPAQLVVMDVGGGSSELSLTSPQWEISVPRGAVNTSEMFLKTDPPTAQEIARMRDDVRQAMREAWASCPARVLQPSVVAVGGTVTTYGSMHLAMASWEAERIHRMKLRLSDIETLTDRLAALTLEQRRHVVGLNPARAAVIVGGGALLEATLLAVGADELRISIANLLHAHVEREARRWYAEHTPQHA